MGKYIIRNGIPVRLNDEIPFEALDKIRENKIKDKAPIGESSVLQEFGFMEDKNEPGVYKKGSVIVNTETPFVKCKLANIDEGYSSAGMLRKILSGIDKKYLTDSNTVQKVMDELTRKDEEELRIMNILADTQQIIRNAIKDEYNTIDNYKRDANILIGYYKDTGDELYKQLATILLNIRKEELPHVGELNKCLSLIDEDEGNLFNKGVREAKKEINNLIQPQEKEE